jgi:hypothetical protein
LQLLEAVACVGLDCRQKQILSLRIDSGDDS